MLLYMFCALRVFGAPHLASGVLGSQTELHNKIMNWTIPAVWHSYSPDFNKSGSGFRISYRFYYFISHHNTTIFYTRMLNYIYLIKGQSCSLFSQSLWRNLCTISCFILTFVRAETMYNTFCCCLLIWIKKIHRGRVKNWVLKSTGYANSFSGWSGLQREVKCCKSGKVPQEVKSRIIIFHISVSFFLQVSRRPGWRVMRRGCRRWEET